VKDKFNNFRYEPNGASTLEDALCHFIQEEIAFGRIKGGEKLPTIGEICEITGLTYGKARRVMERLDREGYVHSRPHIGTVVLSRGKNVLRGRVLFALPDGDASRYHPGNAIDIVGRKMTAAGYAFSVATFSLDENDNLAFLNGELFRATDLVIAVRATPRVQKRLAESGVNHIFLYGDKPEFSERPWIRFSPETAMSHFANHCAKAGVKHVVQVRFDDGETPDAGPSLAKRGIGTSWMTISSGDVGNGGFDDIVRCSCEAFAAMPRKRIKDLFLFWNSFLTQGAITAFLSRGIHLPEDVKVVTFSNTGVGPVYTKPFTRFEVDPVKASEKVGNFALTVLAKGRIPRPPKISPQYIFGATFPF